MRERQLSLHKDRVDLDIIFRRTVPEEILASLRKNGAPETGAGEAGFDAYTYSENAYRRFSTFDMMEYSAEEIASRFHAIQKNNSVPVFDILPVYADKMLTLRQQEPVCRVERILSWNECAESIGQDIMTTAWLAKHDVETCGKNGRQRDLGWAAVLPTDDVRLEDLFRKGLAENHYHLHGSTQSFSLSWACLMNHPDRICEFLKQNFSQNLNLNLQKSAGNIVEPWDVRVKYAAMIRVLLFFRCLETVTGTPGESVQDVFRTFDKTRRTALVKQWTEQMRYTVGEKFKQKNNRYKCLDYAITRHFYPVDEESDVRLLAGERNFLYQCFCRIYSEEFDWFETNLFYVYLLIKSNFRSELIQNNGLVGFANFADYQDRKNQLFGSLDEYWTESQRLSVAMALRKGDIVSLEARIMPKDSGKLLHKEICDLDDRADMALEGVTNTFYYTIHFPKIPFARKEYANRIIRCPRNFESRKKAKKFARAIAVYLRKYLWEDGKQRVYGIDACSKEIGCRPEVFATEFRYIRECSRELVRKKICGTEAKDGFQELGITYHVGEDFLDIIDGLRAIDEAVQFFEMRRGDRIGHAIALGIDAHEYYHSKHDEIYLSKQDYLDNLVWVLFRSLELGVTMEVDHRARMENKARSLLTYIYFEGRYEECSLDMYYRSWRLRGDHPDLYKSGVYRADSSGMRATNCYKNKMCQCSSELDEYRENARISQLYYRYHYDEKVKDRGLEVEDMQIEEQDICLVERLQRAMQRRISKLALAIECNPTSNLRISMMKSYDQHPILKFNDEYIGDDCDNPHLWVSINTDDIGVFDTSLENEYAVMFDAICRMRHKQNNYDDYKVYQYLDYLRQNGIAMAFKKVSAIGTEADH